MIIKAITGGMYESISYLIGENGQALLIDAGVNSKKVLKAAEELNLKIEKVILTHGHIDHILELDNILISTGAAAYIHADDEICLTDAKYNVSAYTFAAKTLESKCVLLNDSSIVRVGQMEFKIIHTPGHTPGSICIQNGDNLFSGDTLFNSGYGRVDLPNGSFEDIYRSIVGTLFSLPANTAVYPGHGVKTTIEDELISNPIKHAVEW